MANVGARCGQPSKTQQLVDRVRSTLFSPTPDGEPGNDDLGAMSAWYVWAAMGLV
jgi:putative alpha-1,2-mannosidase